MEYQLNFLKSVRNKDIPKLKQSGINLEPLHKKLLQLQRNPYITSKAKTGDLQGFRAMDFNKGYRLLFEIDETNKAVNIISIDNHDNAYKKAKQRI